MAYAAYNTTSPNPIVACNNQIAFGSTGGKSWMYRSTHLQTDIGASDFITDGQDLGVNVHDTLCAISLSSAVSFHRCSAVAATTTTWSAGLVISSAS
jgi:hypothetical protein